VTTTLDRPTEDPREDDAPLPTSALVGEAPPEPPGSEPEADEEQVDPRLPVSMLVRPLIAAVLVSSAAGLLAGGIFGSWAARGVGLFAAFFGTGWAFLALRVRRPIIIQWGLLPAVLVLGVASLVPASPTGGPSALPRLMSAAIHSGRVLRPPVPFDAGWRPILIMVIGVLAFGVAWVAAALRRAKLAIAIPLPLVAIALVSQPHDSEVLGGIIVLICLLGALSVLFGGDTARAESLGRQFEIRRAIRGVVVGVPLLVLVIVLANASFLFPKPVYDPANKPLKPRPLPLSAAQDRVLFEVKTTGQLTGPWRTGVLDVYDGKSWRLPPFDTKRFRPIPGEGVLDASRVAVESVTATFIVRDLGDNSTLPGLAGMSKVDVHDSNVVFDPRAGILRLQRGRAPAGLTYTATAPVYPTAAQLEASRPLTKTSALDEALRVPRPPESVAALLQQAPTNPWKRLEFLRKKLSDVVVAVGAGQPVDFPPERIEKLLTGNHEGTPFEIVAAEALLARWAGVPSRIGFGFDGLNNENGALTVRPKNAAQFLEVYFEPYGWVPLSATPPKAKATLDTDPNARFNPTILPSNEVAVEIYLPVELQSLRLLYERIRQALLIGAPYALGALALYMGAPSAERLTRRARRRRWASGVGRREQVAVEYAEFRDLTTDLNVGDPYATAIEFLNHVQEDREHSELAWLVTRSLYGDLRGELTEDDVRAAAEMSSSLRRRLLRGQPVVSRFLAALSRTSLRRPYTREVPSTRIVL
jgi:hypothetical protein